jgi:PilZ domain
LLGDLNKRKLTQRLMTESERRSNLRVPFIAQAELTEDGSSVSIAVRVSDLGNDGCYIDLRAPLPKGTVVFIKIVTARDVFEAEATVAYVDPRLGMGLVFRNVSPRDRTVLQEWLWESEHKPQT